MFAKYYKMTVNAFDPDSGGVLVGQSTTYSRAGWHSFAWPEPQWNYALNSNNSYFPDHPMNYFRFRVEKLVAAFSIQPSSRIIVLGCGGGFLPETFIWWKMQQGIAQATAQSQVAGVDNSTFIQANVLTESHPLMLNPTRILNRSLLDGTGLNAMRNALRNIAGGSEFFDYVITESVIESYTAAERTNFLNQVATYKSAAAPLRNIIHIVCPNWDASADGGSVGMSVAEWAATRNTHSFFDYNYPMTDFVVGA